MTPLTGTSATSPREPIVLVGRLLPSPPQHSEPHSRDSSLVRQEQGSYVSQPWMVAVEEYSPMHPDLEMLGDYRCLDRKCGVWELLTCSLRRQKGI